MTYDLPSSLPVIKQTKIKIMLIYYSNCYRYYNYDIDHPLFSHLGEQLHF